MRSLSIRITFDDPNLTIEDRYLLLAQTFLSISNTPIVVQCIDVDKAIYIESGPSVPVTQTLIDKFSSISSLINSHSIGGLKSEVVTK